MDRSKRWITSALSAGWLKFGLSLLILYHLCAVVFVPNGEFLLGKWSESVLLPYIEFFEFSNRWSFFAPNPGQPMFIDWEIAGKDGATLESGRWPDSHEAFFFRERYNRRVETVEFMMSDDTRIEKLMLPMLCRRSAGANSVRLWRVLYDLPSREEVAKGTRKIGDETNITKKLVSRSFCEPEKKI